MPEGWIPAADWRTVVANVPTVSVDLSIQTDDGVLFGTRTNEPAKGYWFSPGGRVRKFETREEAVHRVVRQECGLDVEIIESLGVFERIYETADVPDVDAKHYLTNGYHGRSLARVDRLSSESRGRSREAIAPSIGGR
jgi:colanic acid biosynthesis protein WcaH